MVQKEQFRGSSSVVERTSQAEEPIRSSPYVRALTDAPTQERPVCWNMEDVARVYAHEEPHAQVSRRYARTETLSRSSH